jgi:hypothetical protein
MGNKIKMLATSKRSIINFIHFQSWLGFFIYFLQMVKKKSRQWIYEADAKCRSIYIMHRFLVIMAGKLHSCRPNWTQKSQQRNWLFMFYKSLCFSKGDRRRHSILLYISTMPSYIYM